MQAARFKNKAVPYTEERAGEKMRLGIFTDAHYSSRTLTCGVRYNSRSLEKMRAAYRFFEAAGCGLVICLGDLIDHDDTHALETANLRRAAEVVRSSALPTVCLMGNHDAFCFTQEAFYAVLGEDTRPSERLVNGKRLVFLDACYYTGGARYLPGGTDWTDTFFPGEAALKRTLAASCEPVWVFVHQNLDPAAEKRHLISNAAGVNRILAASAKVQAVYQGHYHPGCRSVLNGIRYVTFPAMCEAENAFFIEDI